LRLRVPGFLVPVVSMGSRTSPMIFLIATRASSGVLFAMASRLGQRRDQQCWLNGL
jgi:hypothetical protein